MGMGYCVVLTLDEILDSRIREVWNAFELQAIGKTPGQFGEPPHIAISSSDNAGVEILIESVTAASFRRSAVRLIPFGVFLGNTHVLYYVVVLSNELTQAYQKHYELLEARNAGYIKMYSPGNIVFHCTISVDISPSDLHKGIDICTKYGDVLEGSIEAIEIFELSPLKSVFRCTLD